MNNINNIIEGHIIADNTNAITVASTKFVHVDNICHYNNKGDVITIDDIVYNNDVANDNSIFDSTFVYKFDAYDVPVTDDIANNNHDAGNCCCE